MKGTVPTPKGDIKLNVDTKEIVIHTPDSDGGTIRFRSQKKPKVSAGVLQEMAQKGMYELKLDKANTMFKIELK